MLAPGLGRATPAARVGEVPVPAAPAPAAPAPAAPAPAAPSAAPATAAPATPAPPGPSPLPAAAPAPAPAPAAEPGASPAKASSASAISFADPNRSEGFVASALRSIASSAGGMPPWTAEGLGTGPVRRAVAIAAAVSPVHGRRPVRSSYSTMPRL